jgi:hypothetical protein
MRKIIFRQSLIFGSIIGISCFSFFLAMYFVMPNPMKMKRGDIGINIILIWASIWYFKRFRGGVLHFYEAFSIGFLTNLIGALLTGIFIYIFVKYIDSQPFEVWIAESKSFLISQKKNLEVIIDEKNIQRQLVSLTNAGPSTIITDDLMFKQLAIIPISLMSMAMRKIKL